MRTFYYGKDDQSARELVMNFGVPCYNSDVDGLQYHYAHNKIVFDCVLEYKHPQTKKLDLELIEVNREVAKVFQVPLFIMIYFTKPGTDPGDGYGTSEQPAMFKVYPGNKSAWQRMGEFAPGKHWFTPFAFAQFMHWIRGANIGGASKDLPDTHVEYPCATKVDVTGLMAAFKGDK